MNRLTILLASALAVLTSAAAAEPLKTALYVDKGCRGNGVLFWAELLRDSPDVDLKIVDGADIRGGALDDRELLVMPGGDGAPQYKAMGDEGADRVRAFVAKGGKYFGTCCGFSIALNEVRRDRKRLRMLPFKNKPGKVRGGFTAKVRFGDEGARWLGLSEKERTWNVRYHNGPVVVRTDDVAACSNVEVLATVQSELAQFGKMTDCMYGTPAAVRADYGAGRMLVFNCHPEMFPVTRPLVAAGIRALTGREVRLVAQPLKPRGAERVAFVTTVLGSKRAVEEYFALRADPNVDVVPMTKTQLDEDWHGRFDRVVQP